jgi:hypothetical protein
MLLASGVTPNSTKYSPKFMDVVPETQWYPKPAISGQCQHNSCATLAHKVTEDYVKTTYFSARLR